MKLQAVARPRIDGWLLLALAVGGLLRFSRLGDFDNSYYTATVASMLQSPKNFLYASFDPGGAVMVDKPPFSFWAQAIPAAFLGVNATAVSLPQAVAGTVAIAVLYLALKPVFGRVAAAASALTLAVVTAGVVIDSRNEPDSLLSFTLLLAAVCLLRAVGASSWRWLVPFALLMGIAFNIKMLVAYVPLPAFLLYYLLAAQGPPRQVAARAAGTGALLLLVSFSWVVLVALTPADQRPYIGSTRDNSIWTLVFRYNGLDRFGSFKPPTGPAPQQPPGPGGGTTPSPGDAQRLTPPPINPNVPDVGLLGLLGPRLAGQLGWLLPLGVVALLVTLVRLLPEEVYARPAALLAVVRRSPANAHVLLWCGWLATAVVVFGMADATTTHPYYLVNVAVPLAAVLGIGLGSLWEGPRRGGLVAWSLPAALGAAAIYQTYGAQDQVGDWAIALAVSLMLLGLLVTCVAIGRRLTTTPLATMSLALAAGALLLIPAAAGMAAGGRIAGTALNAPRPSGPGPGGPPPESQRANTITAFIRRQGDAGSRFVMGTVSAREAAPFIIISGAPVVAIGGFSGGDPVFSVEAFRAMAERGELRYFLMPQQAAPGGPPGPRSQDAILGTIRRTWQDVSLPAGLKPGTLYRYRAALGAGKPAGVPG
ncbi:MAG: glycosyltransferase family 39 protein [Chloroflexi bacterium]|nr:glycosyltransferase family 39 protein [Chloroflexota bacterium]